jgi:prolyl 4-hydroxylase
MEEEVKTVLSDVASHRDGVEHFESGVTNVDVTSILAENGASVIVDDGVSHPERYVESLDDIDLPFLSYMRVRAPKFQVSRPMGAKFRSFWPRALEMRWDDGTPDGVYSGGIKSMGYSATNTYTGHVFKFHEKRGKKELVKAFTMNDNGQLYIIHPEDTRKGKRVKASKDYKDTMAEFKFAGEYYEEHGIPWLSKYPRNPPVLNIWPADRLGQSHHVFSSHGFFTCDPEKSGSKNCQLDAKVPLKIECVSTSPKVFVIENLMSEFEATWIKAAGEKVIHRSTVGTGDSAYTSKTRTSEHGWLTRSQSKVLDGIFARFADALGIEDARLHHNKNAENLQVVRYLDGQEYTPHHDFGYTGKAEQRFLTLLLYIDIPEEGGGTSFPKAHGGRGLKIKPPRGSGVLFYSMKRDGNSDDFSLHSGMRVLRGNKWICNLWVWDPKVSF